jgi:hypothetical protein
MLPSPAFHRVLRNGSYKRLPRFILLLNQEQASSEELKRIEILLSSRILKQQLQ